MRRLTTVLFGSRCRIRTTDGKGCKRPGFYVLQPSEWLSKMKTIARKILGVVLIMLGLFALLTPFSPGSWLALIGLELLGFSILLEKKLLPLLKPAHRKRIRTLMHRARTVLHLKNPAAEAPEPHPPDSRPCAGNNHNTTSDDQPNEYATDDKQ